MIAGNPKINSYQRIAHGYHSPSSATDYDLQKMFVTLGLWSAGSMTQMATDIYGMAVSPYSGDAWAARRLKYLGFVETVTFYATVPHAVRIVEEAWVPRYDRQTTFGSLVTAAIADSESPTMTVPGTSLINSPYMTARMKRLSRKSAVLGGAGNPTRVTFTHRSSKTKTWDNTNRQPWSVVTLPRMNVAYVYYVYGERVFDAGTDNPGTGAKGATTAYNQGTGNHFWGPTSFGITTSFSSKFVVVPSSNPLNMSYTDIGDTKPLLTQGNLFTMGSDQEPHGGFSLLP